MARAHEGVQLPPQSPLHDAMQPIYMRRAQQIGEGCAPGDWPEVYVLAQALACRIDVYWPAEDSAWLGRSVFGDKNQAQVRMCLLREGDLWTPLLGDIADTDALLVSSAIDAGVMVAEGPDALFDALATLYLLLSTPKPSPHLEDGRASALRACAACALNEQGQTPYALRDTALMQMLALTPSV